MASSSETIASSSSSAPQWKYDVFLSFRGTDTRKNITSDIYYKLQHSGIETFIDDQGLEVGEPIFQSLLAAIENSKFAIVVLSPNYASSTWCLRELAKICECTKENRILPLFYNVNPTDVRFQKMTFAVAFDKLEASGRHEPEEVKQWRDALNTVAGFSGLHLDNYKTDGELADAIVDFVCSKVLPTDDALQSTGDFTIFGATRQALEQIMQALEDNEVTRVGVYGMGGVGKTTLVEHVGQKARKQGLFDRLITLRVTQPPDVRKIQDMLARRLDLKLKDEGEEMSRATILSKRISSRKKILIILDNVWEEITFSSIGIPSNDILKSCNSKVLLTTRRLPVCHQMECQSKIPLDGLSREDSWKLFLKITGKSFESDFKVVARKVATECGGLPIALLAVGKALGDKDLREWKHAARRLEKSQPANRDDEGGVLASIKLSYDFLKDDDSKSCFLLCCLFPEGCNIEIEDLFKYGVGKGLFKDAETIQEAREEAVSVAKHLKASSLLLDSEIDGCVRMHDVIRDTAIQIARSVKQEFLVKAGCGLETWPGRSDQDYSAMSLMRNDIHELPDELVCPNLEILLLQMNRRLVQIPDADIKCSLLRVLDLSYTGISSLAPFIHISNLQGLYLDSCPNLSDISTLKIFKKLKILSMKNYPLKELSTAVGYLTNLRVLDVSGNNLAGGVRIPSGVILKLRELEELSLLFGFWDVEGTSNVQFDEVTRLSKLKTLKVCISDASCIPKKVWVNLSWTDFDIRIGGDMKIRNIVRELQSLVWNDGHKYSRSLVLATIIVNLPTWFRDVVTKNTESLTYENVTGLNNILMEYHHGGLHCLKYLSVIGPNESLETLMLLEKIPSIWQHKPVFEKLEELRLERIGSLKELCSGELPSKSLRNVKILKVHDCPNLGNVLLPSKLLQRLANLEQLICVSMPGMGYIFGCEGFELEQSKLSQMKLLELDAVKSICNGLAPPKMFEALKSLIIYRCKFQGCLFTFDVAECLVQLEEMFIESCPDLERLIEASKKSELGKKTVLPKLGHLCLVELPKLDSGADTDMVCPSLVCLYVKKCDNFKTSASNFGSKYLVKFNDVSQYLAHQNARFEELSAPMGTLDQSYHETPWNDIFYSNSEVVDAPSGDELEQEMLDLSARRPEIKECINEFKVNVPEGVTNFLLRVLKYRALIFRQMPLILEAGMSKIIDLMPELLEKVSPSTFKQLSEVFKQLLPEHVNGNRGINGTPEGLYQFFRMLPELIMKIPPFMVELIKSTPPEEMDTTPEMKDQLIDYWEDMGAMIPEWSQIMNLARKLGTPDGEFELNVLQTL